MSLVLVSPHLDDGVLGAGRHIAGASPVRVITVFAGLPPAGLLTAYDGRCKFSSSYDAVKHRQEEDWRAMSVLDANPIHLPFLDGQYAAERDDDEITAAIREEIGDADAVMVPAGITHPDHELVGRLSLLAAVEAKVDRILVYEDLPSRVLYPDDIARRLSGLRDGEGWALEAVNEPGVDPSLKPAAIACYRSQLVGLVGHDRWCATVPERVWEARRGAAPEPQPEAAE